MKIPFLIILLIFSQGYLIPQTDTTELNTFNVLTNTNFVSIEDGIGNVVYERQFTNPTIYASDIDSDGLNELIIIDSTTNNAASTYILYVFSAIDTLDLIDSIFSGSFFPFVSYSDEIESMIITTGNTEFNQFNTNGENEFLPINIFKLVDDILLQINEELYQPFMDENANLVQILEDVLAKSEMDCETSTTYKGLIAAVFTNYINAGEQALASQTLKNYYSCSDIEMFRREILEIIYPEAK